MTQYHLSIHGEPMPIFILFFFNDTATTEIYTLSLHDALPTWRFTARRRPTLYWSRRPRTACPPDRKSTRLNSSHVKISYAVFCLKKKKKLKDKRHHENNHLSPMLVDNSMNEGPCLSSLRTTAR